MLPFFFNLDYDDRSSQTSFFFHVSHVSSILPFNIKCKMVFNTKGGEEKCNSETDNT